MDLGLAGATAVVAGGTRGIGLATAVCLAGEGCRVGVIGRDEARVEEAASAVQAAGSPEVLRLTADLALVAEWSLSSRGPRAVGHTECPHQRRRAERSRTLRGPRRRAVVRRAGSGSDVGCPLRASRLAAAARARTGLGSST